MIISGGPKRSWALSTNLGVACLALLAIAGCGSNGNAGITFPPSPQPEALVTGVVRMPNGVLAATRSRWQWAERFRLFSPAYAMTVDNPSVFPASGVRVSLERVDHVDAADGVIDSPSVQAGSLDTDESGRYTINKTEAAPGVGGFCPASFMVYVGGLNQHTLTRAFVLAPPPADTDIDVVSETVVRVVLDRLTKAPPVDLCGFPSGSPGLQAITDAVSNAVFTATGSDVEEINKMAFDLAIANKSVKQAINQATGVAVAE